MPRIEGYKILEEIGSGGVGKVYRAIQESMEREVAIKVLSPKFTSDQKFVDEFIKEARAAGQLNHPHIVSVYDVGSVEGMYYYTMVYVEGKTLKDLIKERGALAQKDVLTIMNQMAQALGEAHDKGIVHRDVKPANILIDSAGRSMLSDLGIATLMPKSKKDKAESVPVVGTPQYMSPEQASGKVVDARSDIYSLGATMYHAITGRMPITGTNPKDIIKKVVSEDVLPPIEIRTNISQGVNDLIMRMMEKKVEKRIASEAELIVALKDVAQNSKSSNRPGAKKSRTETAIRRRVATRNAKTGSISRARARRRNRGADPAVLGVTTVIVIAILIFGYSMYKKHVVEPEKQQKARLDNFYNTISDAKSLARQGDYVQALSLIKPLNPVDEKEKLLHHDLLRDYKDNIDRIIDQDVANFRAFSKANPDKLNQQVNIITQILTRYPTAVQTQWLKKRKRELLAKQTKN